MTRTLPTLALPLALAVLASGLEGCRSSRRGVRVGGDVATLTVTMENLASTDTDRPEWIYELSGCIAALNGELTGPSTVAFKAVGLKQGLTGCQLRISSLTPIAGVTFADPTSNVLYFARDFELTQTAAGALASVPKLQKLYTVTSTSAKVFTLKVPVQFAATETGAPISARVKCTPALLDSPLFDRTADATGEFTFKSEIPLEAQYACSDVEVFVDGEMKHTGTLDGTGKFAARPGESVKTNAVVLKAIVKEPQGGATVDVTTTPEACNEDGKVFNTETKKCEDAPE